jgi:hypothetical protein
MSDSKIAPNYALSGEKINFTIEKSRSTLTWVCQLTQTEISFETID